MGIIRNIIVGLLVLNTIGSTLMVPFIYLDFNLRRDYIADVLCINRDEPMTVCNGQCYLSDQLKKANNQHEKQKSTTPNQSGYTFYFEPGKSYTFNTHYFVRDQSYTMYQTKSGISLIDDIFHPPQQV